MGRIYGGVLDRNRCGPLLNQLNTKVETMKQTITQFTFIDEMMADPYSDYSREALEAIFEYIEEFEQSTGEEWEFCRADIRMIFHEYESKAEAMEDYSEAGLEDINFIQLPSGGVVIVIG